MSRRRNKDPLKGAPGHTATAAMATPTTGDVGTAGYADEQDTDSTDGESEETSDESLIDSAFTQLASVFGQDNIDKLKKLVKENSQNAEEKIMQFVRSVTPSAGGVKRHPFASAGAVAAGVGTIFLLREYFSGEKAKAPKKPKKKLNVTKKVSAKSAKPTKMPAKTKAKKRKA
jgi:hypothetical protein